jgi:hypothetical protein
MDDIAHCKTPGAQSFHNLQKYCSIPPQILYNYPTVPGSMQSMLEHVDVITKYYTEIKQEAKDTKVGES